MQLACISCVQTLTTVKTKENVGKVVQSKIKNAALGLGL